MKKGREREEKDLEERRRPEKGRLKEAGSEEKLEAQSSPGGRRWGQRPVHVYKHQCGLARPFANFYISK